ncbi:hypothetical protein B0H14DRAFT_2596680 [Mycena olivaceomarginata]|nr:hypothetical protein B0H14DRAFT_2596680 [Mycena olivaceomarginata]
MAALSSNFVVLSLFSFWFGMVSQEPRVPDFELGGRPGRDPRRELNKDKDHRHEDPKLWRRRRVGYLSDVNYYYYEKGSGARRQRLGRISRTQEPAHESGPRIRSDPEREREQEHRTRKFNIGVRYRGGCQFEQKTLKDKDITIVGA